MNIGKLPHHLLALARACICWAVPQISLFYWKYAFHCLSNLDEVAGTSFGLTLHRTTLPPENLLNATSEPAILIQSLLDIHQQLGQRRSIALD